MKEKKAKKSVNEKINKKEVSDETENLFLSKRNKKRLLKGIQEVKEGKTTKINIDNLWKL